VGRLKWACFSRSSSGSVRRRFSRHDSRVQRDWCLSMDAGRQRKPEQTQSSSAEVPLDKGSLGRQRLPAKAVRPWCRRSSADFGSPRTISHQIMGHGSHALKNLDPGVGARFRRMNRFSGVRVLVASFRGPVDGRSTPSNSSARTDCHAGSTSEAHRVACRRALR